MMKLFLSFNITLITSIMFFINHPLSMGLMILMQTLLICLISGFIINTYWFSYILFLTFLGGLLVLFIYVSSIASNELFNLTFKNKLLLIMIMTMMFLICMLNMNNLKMMNFHSNNYDMNNFFNYFLFFNNENNINLSKLYNSHNYFLMIMLIIYLFITLIVVVKITNIFYGPLRSFN
uniref:NADH-ubiquinone oxidoreductase chain 6 n=1 Tax=Parnara guttata TaxID=218706 RepID=A0A0U1SG29_9NEOP|nr:NADH dehydrogenase subunit 6 [Parnara guttata]AFN21416.1 NADH dehydrogenase subunit 6 [Parnara guttata]